VVKNAFDIFKLSRLDSSTLTPRSGPAFRNRDGLDPIFQSLATLMATAFNNMIKSTFKFKLKKFLNLNNDYGNDARTRYRSLNAAFSLEYQQYLVPLFNLEPNVKIHKPYEAFDKDRTSLTTLMTKLYSIQQVFVEIVQQKVAFYRANPATSTKNKRVNTISNKLKIKARLASINVRKVIPVRFSFNDKQEEIHNFFKLLTAWS